MATIKHTWAKRSLSAILAFLLLFGMNIMQVSAAESDALTVPGTYTVPITSLVSKAPLPAVQQAFAKAFGDEAIITVDENGNKTATVNSYHMIIDFSGENHANVLSVAGGEVLSTKMETYTKGMGGALEDIEVPETIRFPLNTDADGKQVLTITVDFMNAFLGGGNPYPTDVTLTLDFDNAVFDSSAFAEKLASYQAVTGENYTADSWSAFTTALAEAQQAIDTGSAADMTSAMANLETAYNALQFAGADYSKVQAALKRIPKNAALYTPESWAALENAKNAVEQGKALTDQALVDGWASEIEAKINALVYADADYSKVDEAIAAIPADLSVYTEESVNTLRNAQQAVVRGLKSDRQDEINAWADSITAAIKALKVPGADYAKVEEALAKVPNDLSKYTAESAKAVQDAVQAVVRDLDKNEQEKVNQMAEKIAAAVQNLQEKKQPAPTPKPEQNKPKENSDTGTLDINNLKDGIYEVPVWLWHATNDQASMAASSVNNTARIVVENGVKTMYIYTQPMTMGNITASLQELKIYDLNGNYSEATVQSKDSDGNPNCFSFTLPHTQEYIQVKVNPHVEMMGNQDIDARIRVDYSSIQQISSSTKDTTINLTKAAAGSSAPKGTGTNPKTGDNSNYMIYVYVALMSACAVGAAVLLILKRRKTLHGTK